MRSRRIVIAWCLLLAFLTLGAGLAELRRSAPLVLFDAAHHNVHAIDGRYLDFARLLEGGGFRVEKIVTSWTAAVFDRAAVVIVPAPRGADRQASMAERSRAAFTRREIEVMEQWVERGGGLLLVTDHPPVGSAAAALAAAFGVEGSLAFTEDPLQGDGDGRLLVFDRADGGIGDHPALEGAAADESVDRVATYLGQSLAGPAESVALLRLAESARDRERGFADGSWMPPRATDRTRSAAGRSQAVALEAGAGRVIVLAEAGMLLGPAMAVEATGPGGEPIHNRRFALNAVRWLAGR